MVRPGRGLPLLAALLVAGGCALPRWPVDGTLTSPFGLRLRGWRPELHRGVDVAAPRGTPVHPVRRGRVRFAGRMSGYGNVVWVDHGEGLQTVYAHLADIAVHAGEDVEGRTVLGHVGASGDATAPHLHFEVRRRGRAVDPVPLLGRRPATPGRAAPGSPP